MTTLSLRLEDSQYDALKLVADAEGIPVSKAIRDAIDGLLDERASNPEFQALLQRDDERRTAALEFLKRPTTAEARMRAHAAKP